MKLHRLIQATVVSVSLLVVLPASAQRDRPDHGQPRTGQPHERARSGGAPSGRRPSGGDVGGAQRRPAQPPATRPDVGQRPQGPRPSTPPPSVRRPGDGHRPGGLAVPRRVPPGPLRLRAYREPGVYGYARPRIVVPVIGYPRPFYVFRPRFWLGFGIYIGYPVPYPLMFGPPGYVYGDGLVIPEPSRYGGVSLDIRPDTAVVFVDGVYVGLARDFSPLHQPLTLTPGFHHIELQEPGTIPLAFNVNIVAGEVQPFNGMLQVE